jgi:cobalt-zinc-cadmium efflux system membrane fusion protein
MRKLARLLGSVVVVGALVAALFLLDIRVPSHTATAYETSESGASEAHGVARPASVEVDEASQRLVGVSLATAVTRDAHRVVHAFCQLNLDLNRQVLVKTFVSGMVERRLVEQGEHVRAGDPLFVLRSNDLAVARGAFMSAKAQLDLAKAVFDRDEILVKEKIVSATQYDTDKAGWLTARNAWVNAREQLFIDGLSAAEVDAVSYENQEQWLTAVVKSPIDGEVVTLTNAHAVGDLVPSGTDLCQVADLTQVWAIGNAYEKDLGDLRVDAPVELTFVSYPGLTWRGKVANISHVVNLQTRTVDVRVVLENGPPRGADGAAAALAAFPLKPGLFGNMAIEARAYPAGLVWVPTSAFLPYFYTSGEKSILVTDDGTHFAERRVEVAFDEAGSAGVRGDLRPGERVVTQGNIFVAKRWEER